jgi:hypothetical protein
MSCDRALRHGELVRATEVFARDSERGSRTYLGLLRRAVRRHDIFQSRRVHHRPRTLNSALRLRVHPEHWPKRATRPYRPRYSPRAPDVHRRNAHVLRPKCDSPTMVLRRECHTTAGQVAHRRRVRGYPCPAPCALVALAHPRVGGTARLGHRRVVRQVSAHAGRTPSSARPCPNNLLVPRERSAAHFGCGQGAFVNAAQVSGPLPDDCRCR